MAIWQENYGNNEVDEITYDPVPQNLLDLFPPRNEEEICVVCRDELRTHALLPCGHRVLCVGCVSQLISQRCAVCNTNFTNVIRIW